MKTRVTAVLLLLAALAFFAWRQAGQPAAGSDDKSAKSTERRDSADAAGDRDPFADPSADGADAKSDTRPDQVPASIDGTLAQLGTPLPGPVEYPEQTLRERIVAMNNTLKEAGVGQAVLRIRVNEQHESKEQLLEMKVPAYSSARGALPGDILKHCCDALIVRYQVKEGVAIITPAG